jgi:hypothetical protein
LFSPSILFYYEDFKQVLTIFAALATTSILNYATKETYPKK